jgi:hypothetical protein
MSIKVLPTIIGIGLASSLALGGCSLIPHVPNLGGGNTSNGGSSDGSGTQHVALPAGFPTDVPLVSTDYAYALKVSDTSWGVFVRVDDATSGYEKASQLLTDAGFTKHEGVGGTSNGVSIGSFTNGTYTMQLTATPTKEYGPVVEYVIVKSNQ